MEHLQKHYNKKKKGKQEYTAGKTVEAYQQEINSCQWALISQVAKMPTFPLEK